MVQGFERAMQEYERHLTAPYDEGGALYNYEEECNYDDYFEDKAYFDIKRMKGE